LQTSSIAFDATFSKNKTINQQHWCQCAVVVFLVPCMMPDEWGEGREKQSWHLVVFLLWWCFNATLKEKN